MPSVNSKEKTLRKPEATWVQRCSHIFKSHSQSLSFQLPLFLPPLSPQHSTDTTTALLFLPFCAPHPHCSVHKAEQHGFACLLKESECSGRKRQDNYRKSRQIGHAGWQYRQRVGKWEWEQCVMKNNGEKRRSSTFTWGFSSSETFTGEQKVKASMGLW